MKSVEARSSHKSVSGSRRRVLSAWRFGALASTTLLLFVMSATSAAAEQKVEGSGTAWKGDERVVNGTPAPEGSWPSMALIRTNGSFCGGTLIAPSWVLSAAHCFSEFLEGETDVSETTVAVGSTSYYGAPEQAVSGVFPNKGYSGFDSDNDIALIRLESPSSQPAQAFATSNDEALYAPDTTGFIAGWGTTCYRSCSWSRELLQASVTLRSFEMCEGIYNSAGYPFASNSICAGGGLRTSDTCQGDSGGPLLANGPSGRVLIGIVSWGIGCGMEEFPGVYTKVANYTSWIGDTALDRVNAPRQVRVRRTSTIVVRNQSSLALPATVASSVGGSFQVKRTTCRQPVPFGASCSVTVKDGITKKGNRGTLVLQSAAGATVARVKLRG